MHDIGVWSDRLTKEEVDFTQKILVSSQNSWLNQLVENNKIKRTLELLKNPKNMSSRDIKAAKADLFEIRIAYAIHQSGYSAIYEHKTGVGDYSVDFFIYDNKIKEQHDWLVELTSTRDSEDVKQNTTQKNSVYSYITLDNNQEVKDIWRVQQAILSKVGKKPAIPIKFPLPNGTTYNAIIIDVRAMNIGMVDENDLKTIMYGSKCYTGPIYREFIEKNDSHKTILGICDPKYEDQDLRARCFRERIHVVGFINEKKYEKGFINSNIQTFCNPHLTSELDLELPIKI